MSDKVVVVTGAGFSYPAKLPIQSGIINEMLKKPEVGFMGDWDLETFKFYRAYIEVGIFLIENYTKRKSNAYRQKMQHILTQNTEMKNERDFVAKLSQNGKIAKEIEGTKHIKSLFSKTNNLEEVVIKNDFIKKLSSLKEEIRSALSEEKVFVDLEDLFTKLDKCVQTQSSWKKYSFIQVIQIKQYILQLFIYYFGKKNAQFVVNEDYESFAEFIAQNNVSVVTTNWDTLCEQIFESQGIKCDLCLSCDSYYHINKRKNIRQIAKIHGSISWFSCSNCGSLNIKSKGTESHFLLSDKKNTCKQCGVKQQDDFLFTPEIITPTMVKMFSKQLYNNIWQNAEYMLKDAQEIIFVGYSMPLADFEFRYMLTKYISPSAKIKVVLHKLDKKNPDERREVPEDRYKCAFPKNDMEFFYDGFTSYFNERNSQ